MDISNPKIFPGTFSILGISPDSKLMDIAVASGSACVGDRVPHAKLGIGAVASGGDLALRLAKALRAESQNGGDKRRERSAALIVISSERIEVEMKIGASTSSVEELLNKLKTVIRAT